MLKTDNVYRHFDTLTLKNLKSIESDMDILRCSSSLKDMLYTISPQMLDSDEWLIKLDKYGKIILKPSNLTRFSCMTITFSGHGTVILQGYNDSVITHEPVSIQVIDMYETRNIKETFYNILKTKYGINIDKIYMQQVTKGFNMQVMKNIQNTIDFNRLSPDIEIRWISDDSDVIFIIKNKGVYEELEIKFDNSLKVKVSALSYRGQRIIHERYYDLNPENNIDEFAKFIKEYFYRDLYKKENKVN